MKPIPPSKKKTNHDPSESGDNSRSAVQTYLKYSGLAFQLLAAVGLAAWGGIKLDAHFGNRFPFITLLLVVLALVGSMFLLIRQLPKE
ncbi:MAG: AtpZ/AtpI family protein [Tunicatimonas sp.]